LAPAWGSASINCSAEFLPMSIAFFSTAICTALLVCALLIAVAALAMLLTSMKPPSGLTQGG
jgi:hypothetical protein